MNKHDFLSPSKAIASIALIAAMAATTNNALAQNLASNSNSKAKTEIKYKDLPATANVNLFERNIGVLIPNQWVNYTDTVLDAMDPDERVFAEQFMKKELLSIPEKDRVAYAMIILNMILDAHTGNETTSMMEAYGDQAMNWIDRLDKSIKTYVVQLNELNKKIITDNQKAITDNQKAITDNQKEYLADAKTAEMKLQEVYKLNPQGENTKKVAVIAKKVFDQTKYGYD